MGTTDVTPELESLAYLPRFEPNSRSLDPSEPETSDSPETDTSRYGPSDPRPDTSGTPTHTSGSTGDVKPATVKEVGELVAALLAAVAVGAGLFVRWRTRNQRKLRQPTKDECREVAAPLGRIAYRHVPLSKLAPDLADAVLAAVGLTNYLDAGPLTSYEGTDPGIPADLNQETYP